MTRATGSARRCRAASRTRAIRTAISLRRPAWSRTRPTPPSASRTTWQSSAAAACSRTSASITAPPMRSAPTVTPRVPAASGPIPTPCRSLTTTTPIRGTRTITRSMAPTRPIRPTTSLNNIDTGTLLCEGWRVGGGARRHDSDWQRHEAANGNSACPRAGATRPSHPPRRCSRRTATISLPPYTYGRRRSTTTTCTTSGRRSTSSGRRVRTAAPSAPSPTIRQRMPRPTRMTTRTCMRPMVSIRRASARRDVLAGVRVESTHATYRGNLYNSDTDTNTPASQSNSYTNAFPTLQGRYYFSDELVGRLTYATGIARPGFEQITPGASISVVNASVTVGNPAQAHHWPEPRCHSRVLPRQWPDRGARAVRQVSSTTTSCCRSRSCRATTSPGSPAQAPHRAKLQQRTRTCRWLEAQYQQQLLFLPRPWDGFGYSANATWSIHGRDPPGHLRTVALHFAAHLECRIILRERTARGASRRRLRRPESVFLRQHHVERHRCLFARAAHHGSRRQLCISHPCVSISRARICSTRRWSSPKARAGIRPIQREFYDLTLLGRRARQLRLNDDPRMLSNLHQRRCTFPACCARHVHRSAEGGVARAPRDAGHAVAAGPRVRRPPGPPCRATRISSSSSQRTRATT